MTKNAYKASNHEGLHDLMEKAKVANFCLVREKKSPHDSYDLWKKYLS